eukprot:350235_1
MLQGSIGDIDLLKDINATTKIDELFENYQIQTYPANIVKPIDNNKSEYKLVIGYLRKLEITLPLIPIIPSEIVKLIYIFYVATYHMIKGNELCLIKPNERIFTTVGHETRNSHTFFKITKPLNSGIVKFKMQCIVSARQATSIGVITNLHAHVPQTSWLFDDESCKESIQMYLCESPRKTITTLNAIYRYEHGRTVYSEDISSIKWDEMKNNQTTEFILDFNKYEITFFIDSIQIGKPVTIKQNTTYYAAFAFLCYYPGSMERWGAATYKLCSTPTFP